MNTHPAAKMFPLMSPDDYASLKNDIATNGLVEPITLYQGNGGVQVLDGRNRLAACQELGIEPRTEFYEGDFPAEYVISKNLKRRNLNASQRAVLAHDYLHKFGAEAEARRVAAVQAANRARAAKQPGLKEDGLSEPDDPYRASLHDMKAEGETEQVKGRDHKAEHEAKAATQAAKLTDASSRYVSEARRIQNVDPRLNDLIKEGKLDIPQAKEVIKLQQSHRQDIVTYLEGSPALEREECRKIIQQAKRVERNETIAAKTSGVEQLTGKKKYNVILLDPPWQYRNNVITGAAENHYPTMSQSELLALPVIDIKAADSVLLMWTTGAMLKDACELIDVWEFELQSNCVWVKTPIDTGGYRGYYFKMRHELLLLATCGTLPPPEAVNRFNSVIESPKLLHSEKPVIFHQMIETMYPGLSKIELFARRQRENWDCWGDQVAQ